MCDLNLLSKNVSVNGHNDKVDGNTVQILASGLGDYDAVQEICLTPKDAVKLSQALLDAVNALRRSNTYEEKI